MKSECSPFDRMYASFSLFAQAAAGRGGRFLQMSAGANWVNACPAVIQCLHRELDAGLTYRNYGRSAGLVAVTDVLEYVECELNSRQYQPSVTLTNGSAEGAHLAFDLLFIERRARNGDVGLMIGHGFPLYAKLCDRFGLQFREVLNESEGEPDYLPCIDEVVRRVQSDKPAMVFLIVPNNPIGECYPEGALRRLVQACDFAGSTLLVDRVCLLPWDDYTAVSNAIAPLMAAGRCFILDSFSKAESLAGLRTGFIVSDAANRDLLIELTRTRSLNPIIFSTLTLAFCRLAMLTAGSPDDPALALANALGGRLMDECPMAYTGPDLQGQFTQFRFAYSGDLVERERIIRENHDAIRDRFSKVATREMRLDAGFNVAVTLPTMSSTKEESDQLHLAHEHGVGILTEACFRTSKRILGNYFVRLGLTLPPNEFRRGLCTLGEYYHV